MKFHVSFVFGQYNVDLSGIREFRGAFYEYRTIDTSDPDKLGSLVSDQIKEYKQRTEVPSGVPRLLVYPHSISIVKL